MLDMGSTSIQAPGNGLGNWFPLNLIRLRLYGVKVKGGEGVSEVSVGSVVPLVQRGATRRQMLSEKELFVVAVCVVVCVVVGYRCTRSKAEKMTSHK